MKPEFSDHDLEAYLEEVLDVHDMVRIETALRGDPTLVTRMADLLRHRDQGTHALGAIWRRHRLSCPNREVLGSFLLDALEPPQADYVYFHITEVGCRMCQANLRDLEEQKNKLSDSSSHRRRRIFQTSAGYLPPTS